MSDLVCRDGKLNASSGFPTFFHKHGRHPHAENEKDGHDRSKEGFKCTGSVGVGSFTTSDSERVPVKPVVISVPAVADFAPFVRRVDDGVLESVDELREGDVSAVAKDVKGLEIVIVGSVLEFHSDEVTGVRSRTADELYDQS